MQKVVHPTTRGAGLGSMLLAKLGTTPAGTSKVTRPAVIKSTTKAAAVTPHQPAAVLAVALASVQRRDGLYGPLFALTKAAVLSKPNQPLDAPSKPATPASMSTPSTYVRAPAQEDSHAVRHAQQLLDTATARAKLIADFKAAPMFAPGTGPVPM